MTLALPISDATIWSIPYDRKTFIVQASGLGQTLLPLLRIMKRVQSKTDHMTLFITVVETFGNSVSL